MKITKENYFSKEVRTKYMASTTFLGLLFGCQDAVMNGFKEEKSCFIEGNYLHSWSEGTLEKYEQENYDKIYSKAGATKGSKKVFYKELDKTILTLEKDKNFMGMIAGEKEVIKQFRWLDMDWIIRMDVFNEKKGFITDLKFIRSLQHREFDKDKMKYVSWLEYRHYIHQMFIYRKIEQLSSERKKMLPTFIAAVTKEKPFDRAILSFDEEDFKEVEEEIEISASEIKEVFEGRKEPTSCGVCEYCRSKQKIRKIENWRDVVEGDRL